MFSLFEASRRFTTQVREIKIKRNEIHIGKPLHEDGEVNGEFLYYSDEHGGTYNSLRDHNIGEGSGYNDWYWFTTRESAELYLNPRPQEFEVGSKYQWVNIEAPHNQGRRHGPLTCVHVGMFQGLFDTETKSGAGFENRNGLHIIATEHLRKGLLVKVCW